MYLRSGPAAHIKLIVKQGYSDPYNLGTFAAHYDACRDVSGSPKTRLPRYNSVYDLLLDTSLIVQDTNYGCLVNEIARKVAHKFEYNVNCDRSSGLCTTLNSWQDVPEVEELASYILPKIEESVYSCWVRVESAAIYRNIPTETPKSSWLWHYDNCPDEYTKVIINLTDVSSVDGPMEFLSGPKTAVPKYLSSRINPSYSDLSQYMFHNSRIPSSVIANCLSTDCTLGSLTGPRGTCALFSPNQPHRARSPISSQQYRDILIYSLRPTLGYSSRYNQTIGQRAGPYDDGVYSLD